MKDSSKCYCLCHNKQLLRKVVCMCSCNVRKDSMGNDLYPPLYDEITKPLHYNSSKAKCECGRRIECIDITRTMNFNLGNVMKYIWRAEHKGKVLSDLKKARWYLDDQIKLMEKA